MNEGGQIGADAGAFAFLDLGGEMGRLIRAFDWAATSLGPIEQWPRSLRIAVGMILPSPVPIVMLWGEDGVMIYNDAYSGFAGGRHPALLGSKVREGWPEVADFNDNVMKVGLAGGTLSYRDQELTLHRHGRPEQVCMNLDYSPVLDDSGKPAGVIAIVVETTGGVAAARALKESEARFREVADSAPSPVWVTGEQGGVEFANRAFAEFSGRSAEELLGNAWVSLIHPDDLPAVAAARAEAWDQKKPYAFEARFRWADGEWRAMLVSSSPRIDADGAIKGYVGMAVDLTDIRRAGEAMRESEARFRRIADSSPTPMWVSRLDRKREFVNRAYLDFLGLAYDEAIDFDWREILHPDDHDRVVAESVAGEASRQSFELEGRYRRGDGEWRWLHSISQPRFDGEGELTGFIGVAHDITRSKQAEVTLAARIRRLDLLARIAGGLVVEMSPEQSLEEAFDAIAREIGADYYFNYLVDDEQPGRLLLASSKGLTEEQREAFGGIAIGEYMCGRVASRREAIIAADIDTSDDPACAGLQLLGGKSYAGFPLIFHGRLIGTISFSSRERSAFDDEQVPLMRTVADQAAAALDRARVIAALRVSEERLRALSAEQAAILAQLAEGVIVTDEAGAITFVNEAAARIHGVAKLDVTPNEYSESYHLFTEDGKSYPPAELPLARVVASGEPLTDERWRIRTPDGRDVLAVGSARPVIAADNRRIGSVLTLRDETARVAAEEALRSSEARLRQKAAEFEALAENVSQLAWMAEPEGSIFWYNRRWYEYTGTDLQSMKDWGWRDVHHPDLIDGVIAEVSANWAGGEPWEGTYLIRSAEAEYRWFLTRAEPIRDEAGKLVRWFGTNTDITAQKTSEARQQFLLSLTDRLGDLTEPRAIVAAAVEVLGRQLGVSRVGYGEICDDDVRVEFETDYVDGVEHLIGTFPIDNFGAGNFVDLRRGLTTTFADLEADPRTAGAGFPEARSAMAVPLIRDGRLKAVLYLNHREIHEWLPDEVVLVEDVAARTWDALERARAETKVRELNITLEQRVVERTAQLRASEAALRQSQKMEAIGKLTGGVAHDFNNLLQVVSGNLELLERDIAGDERAERRVRNAREGVARGAKLASQLLAFGRRQPLEPKVINIGRFVTGLDDMLRRALGEEIEIETRVDEGLWNTLADPSQIENALLNLAINARDAMGGEGRLSIAVENVGIHASSEAEEVAPGDYVMIAVGDTGAGIPDEIVDKVFEPFFSTKPEGKGTGLGLSMVYGFIKQSGGYVRIDSAVGAGTTVRLYLPRADRAEDAANEAVRAPLAGGSEAILVVEDDDDVRGTVVETLRELGYRVIEASDAESALAIVEGGARVDLLFTDVVMPGTLRSPDLARLARERLPDLAVLFTSGYTEDAIVHDGRLDEGVRLISKPYSSEALAAKIRQALAGSPEVSSEPSSSPKPSAATSISPG